MHTRGTLLYLRANESQVERFFLQHNGYRVFTAYTVNEALAFLSSRRLDAIVIECSDGSGVVRIIKKANPGVPILAIVNSLDLPDFASDSVDALVATFDGSQFLLDTLHFLLKVKPREISQRSSQSTQSTRDYLAKTAADAWRARVTVA